MYRCGRAWGDPVLLLWQSHLGDIVVIWIGIYGCIVFVLGLKDHENEKYIMRWTLEHRDLTAGMQKSLVQQLQI